jgi:UDP-galactopyranose mutase
MNYCDVLIVGAGLAGMVMAERLALIGKRCIVIDKRAHIGGNAFDYIDQGGVLVHAYGPHLFHTNSKRVADYLSQFTTFIPTAYTASSFTHRRHWSFPVNLKTYEQLIGRPSTTEEMEDYLAKNRISIPNPKNSEEAILSQVGHELYEMFYKGYTKKQWGRDPKDLDASVCARIPIRTNRNDLYFNDTYQMMPVAGYTAMFENMLHSSQNIEFIPNMSFYDFSWQCIYKHLVYTGPIDEFFLYEHGRLPYRTLRFEHETIGPEHLVRGFWQPTTSVAYPNDFDYTRIVEIKHATGQKCPNTTIVREYPKEFVPGDTPYYPIPNAEAKSIYKMYEARAEQLSNVTFVGRLATYKYLNMDQVVAMSLAEFERLREKI